MSKVVVVISGGRFLKELNLPDDETLTPQAVCYALAELTVEERQSLTDRCTLSEMIEDINNCDNYVGDMNFRTIEELRRLIKHERNPMAKLQLQRELSCVNSYCGKHSKGRKRRK